ncbi:hypothetical protein GQ43DRAFT_406519 [Delitschia confertaspora ATCC 74209]|uniref:FHA domain-containing protein n=1 Tax=Delitschia confertaspora ATCC 74209 TaxID=1513339 RepID=A0A9P4JZ81_9PLEO|nr:hypothetical protein GQ43DRAFT_406519 [Delitschia confertaspora ATCC 74209]
MWILEHETLFEGKKVWLKPGSRHLIGRTHASDHNEGRTGQIESKLVSRKHIIISVSKVPAADGTKLHSSSKIEITDTSKFGTSIDGAPRIKDQTVVLSGTEHTIQLGSWPPLLKIKWQPVVFTYAAKENKESQARSARLHALDIKTSNEFVYDKTTHVVTLKRNLPRVLQGLVSGKPIVTAGFLDAVIEATTSSGPDSDIYTPCKLEVDFDRWWPNESHYIPPSAQEPVPRDAKLLEPDPSRSEVFSGLTFVFLDEKQYQSLADPIHGGGGKAHSFTVRPGETTVDEYVQYVRSLADKKRGRGPNDRLPVVTVRLSTYPDGMEEWATAFVNGVDRALNQRSILQNEFLDAIIMKDASTLRRPPPEDIEVNPSLSALPGTTWPREPTPTFQSQSISQSQAPEPTTESVKPESTKKPTKTIPSKRPFRRGAPTSRFTGFDDYEPPSKTRKIQEEDSVMSGVPQSELVRDSHPESESQSQSLFVSQRNQTQQSPPAETINKVGPVDELFPTAAGIRRMKRQTQVTSASEALETGTLPVKLRSQAVEALEKLQKAKKKVKEIDVREQVRLRTLAEEEARKADEENLRQALEGVDISSIRGLAKIEEMDVPLRAPRSAQTTDRSDRWDDSWNGRKNFKKFRRRDTERGPQAQRILVTLEEVPLKKGFGLGESYFLEENSKSNSVRSQQDESSRTPQISRGNTIITVEDGESEPEQGFTRRKGRKVVESDGADDEEVFPEEIAGTPRKKRITERIEETQVRETQRGHTQTQAKTGTSRGKRTAASSAEKPPPSKKARGAAPAIAVRDGDSDGEEGGFRFRRRKR